MQLPWGSLLRGALALDPDVTAGIARLVAPGGSVRMLLAPAARDGLSPHVDVEHRLGNGLAGRWAAAGLALVEARPATAEDIERAASTWARRLRLRPADAARRAFHVELRRPREGVE